jgi:hypothetical protein
MKILAHDCAEHHFQVQLSRASARRSHQVLHQFRYLLQQIGALTKLHEPSGGQIHQSLC